eukprot:3278869-Karenia_brevis.AAC.1
MAGRKEETCNNTELNAHQAHRSKVKRGTAQKGGGSCCRIATWNISTFDNFGANEAIDFAIKHDIDIFCFQESRMSAHSKPGYDHIFQKEGYQLLPGPFDVDTSGKPYGGVAIATRWPVSETRLPAIPADEQHPMPGLDK